MCEDYRQRVLEGHLAGGRGHPVRKEVNDAQLPRMMPEMSVEE